MLCGLQTKKAAASVQTHPCGMTRAHAPSGNCRPGRTRRSKGSNWSTTLLLSPEIILGFPACCLCPSLSPCLYAFAHVYAVFSSQTAARLVHVLSSLCASPAPLDTTFHVAQGGKDSTTCSFPPVATKPTLTVAKGSEDAGRRAGSL